MLFMNYYAYDAHVQLINFNTKIVFVRVIAKV